MDFSLNKEQQLAVEYVKGHSLILAGAGSGKTRVLISKVLHLITHHKARPDSILMVTFTNKAAREMKQRIELSLEMQKKTLGFIGTFHSFSAWLLRKHGSRIGIPSTFSIYDENDSRSVVMSILKELDKKKSPAGVLHAISNAKNQLLSPDNYLEISRGYDQQMIAEIYAKYEKRLAEAHALDFDDLLAKAVLLLLKSKITLKKYQSQFKFILIDEFQDTNPAQYKLAQLLASTSANVVTAVGDFSQSIYSWRGADIRNLERFQTDFPQARVFHLEQNYRSTQPILELASKVITHNASHPILYLRTEKIGGEMVEITECSDEMEEADYIAEKAIYCEGKVVILYRTNAQSRILEEAFLQRGIPYKLVGGVRFYERKEIKDILSLLRFCMNPKDQVSWKRIGTLGKRKLKKFEDALPTLRNIITKMNTHTLIDKLMDIVQYRSYFDEKDQEDMGRLENVNELLSVAEQFPDPGEFLQQIALVESEYFDAEKKGENADIVLMTLHQAKGLEFPTVIISGVEEGTLPHIRSLDDSDRIEEERRLLYVGITRAKIRLIITYVRSRMLFGVRSRMMKSRFLFEAEGKEPESTGDWY